MAIKDPFLEAEQSKKEQVLTAIYVAMTKGQPQDVITKIAKDNGLKPDEIKAILHLGYNVANGSGVDEIKKADQYSGFSDNIKDYFYNNFSPIAEQQRIDAAATEQNNQPSTEIDTSGPDGSEDTSQGESQYPIGPVATYGAAGFSAVYIVGELIKGLGRYLYTRGVGQSEAQGIAKSYGKKFMQSIFGGGPDIEPVRTTPDTALNRGYITDMTMSMGNRAASAKQTADRIWEKIGGYIEDSKALHSFDDIMTTALGEVKKVKNQFERIDYGDGLMEVEKEMKAYLTKNGYDLNNLTTSQLQDLKAHLTKMEIPKSAYSAGGVIKESYAQGISKLTDALRTTVSDTIAREYNLSKSWITKQYADYGNMVDLWKTSIKQSSKTPSTNFQMMMSKSIGGPVIDVSTFAGKTFYKGGQIIAETGKLPYTIVKEMFNYVKNFVQKNAGHIQAAGGQTPGVRVTPTAPYVPPVMPTTPVAPTIPGTTPSTANIPTTNIPTQVPPTTVPGTTEPVAPTVPQQKIVPTVTAPASETPLTMEQKARFTNEADRIAYIQQKEAELRKKFGLPPEPTKVPEPTLPGVVPASENVAKVVTKATEGGKVIPKQTNLFGDVVDEAGNVIKKVSKVAGELTPEIEKTAKVTSKFGKVGKIVSGLLMAAGVVTAAMGSETEASGPKPSDNSQAKKFNIVPQVGNTTMSAPDKATQEGMDKYNQQEANKPLKDYVEKGPMSKKGEDILKSLTYFLPGIGEASMALDLKDSMDKGQTLGEFVDQQRLKHQQIQASATPGAGSIAPMPTSTPTLKSPITSTPTTPTKPTPTTPTPTKPTTPTKAPVVVTPTQKKAIEDFKKNVGGPKFGLQTGF